MLQAILGSVVRYIIFFTIMWKVLINCMDFFFLGNMPKESSFSMHSLLVCHYLHGAWYPKGGASEIAYHMIPIIEKAGGAVLVRAPVNRILFNEANEAIGNISNLGEVLFVQ